MKRLRPLLIFLLLGIALGRLAAQSDTLRHTIYFSSGNAQLSSEAISGLEALLPRLLKAERCTLNLEGHTDGKGNPDNNLQLSQERNASVLSYLTSMGLRPTHQRLFPYGDTRPAGNNQTRKGRKSNRRVELSAYLSDSLRPEKPDTLAPIFQPHHPQLYRLLSDGKDLADTFCIDPSRDTTLRGRSGMLIFLPANAFGISDPDTCLLFSVISQPSLAQRLVHRVTAPNPDSWYSPNFEVLTAASYHGQALPLAPGKEMQLFLPMETIHPDVEIFSGPQARRDTFVHWHPEPEIELGQVLPCQYSSVNCVGTSCHLFWCKITLFITGGRRPFRQAHRDSRARQKWLKKRIYRPNLRKPIYLEVDCDQLDSLMSQYGAHNISSLREALTREKYAKYGVSNNRDLLIAMEKERLEDMERKAGSRPNNYYSAQYYTLNASSVGWTGLFDYHYLKKEARTTFKVNSPLRDIQDTYLYFPETRTLLSANAWRNGHYIFRNVPRNKDIYVLGFMQEEGIAYLGVQQINTNAENCDLKFQQADLNRIHQVLREIEK